MIKLKDIVHKTHNGTQKLLASKTEVNSSAPTLLATTISNKLSLVGIAYLGISPDKQSEFAEQAASIVTDDVFLDELQEQIGIPQPHETEDDFVASAKEKMRVLLKSKLK